MLLQIQSRETLIHCWCRYKRYLERVSQLVIKLNVVLLDDPVFMVLGLHTQSWWKIMSSQNTYTDIYNNFNHNSKNLEATKKFFTGWINKKWYLYLMEYYSVLKKGGGGGCQSLRRHGKLLNSYYLLKEVYLKKTTCNV